ncbi:MAG: addiction module protein [Verrucomicrobiota bacterium]
MIAETIPALAKLTPREKYILASELWEELESSKEGLPIEDSVVRMLEERHQEYLANPTKVVSWESIQSKLGKS